MEAWPLHLPPSTDRPGRSLATSRRSVSIASLTGLPAVLAVAAFTLPLAVLLAAASYHLALVLVGPTAAYWTLLAVPLTLPFARLTDVSAVVLASVTAAAAISLCVPSGRLAVPAAELRGRSRGVLLAAAIGATFLDIIRWSER